MSSFQQLMCGNFPKMGIIEVQSRGFPYKAIDFVPAWDEISSTYNAKKLKNGELVIKIYKQLFEALSNLKLNWEDLIVLQGIYGY